MDFESFLIRQANHFVTEFVKESLSSKKPRKGFPKNVKKLVLEWQNHGCNVCGKVLSLVNYDHIDGNRANNAIWNCQALCPNCHARKTRKRR